MSNWWRRNAAALGILAVLVPATVLTIGWREWHEVYDNAGRRTFAIEVPVDGTTELAGATWGPVRSGALEDLSGLDAPAGTRVIAAAIMVSPDGHDPVACMRPVLVEQSTGRQWNEMRIELGFDYNPDEPTACVSDATEPYEIFVPFVVPDDAEGPFWVDVAPLGVGSTFVRFAIEP